MATTRQERIDEMIRQQEEARKAAEQKEPEEPEAVTPKASKK